MPHFSLLRRPRRATRTASTLDRMYARLDETLAVLPDDSDPSAPASTLSLSSPAPSDPTTGQQPAIDTHAA